MAAFYTFEDLSGAGVNEPKTDNPYQDVISSCENHSNKIQARYEAHRTKRNAQQREKMLAQDFPGVTIDETLVKLENPQTFPGFVDPRHCLCFWARPTSKVRSLVTKVQNKLLEIAPNLWIMPSQSLHMTCLEVAHSQTQPDNEALVEQLLPHAQDIADFTRANRARLVKPILSYDAQALALSYVPADGETGRSREEDRYTYHHLRRDVFSQCMATQVKIGSRYVIPSAHLTIARYVTTKDYETDGKVDAEKIQQLLAKADEINEWLVREYWPQDDSVPIQDGGEWVVGDEQGLDFRKGTLWYGGGGETILLGRGF